MGFFRKNTIPAATFAILSLGVGVRCWLAPMAVQADTGAFQSWMESAVKLGLAQSYTAQVSSPWLPTYPPLSIAILGTAGSLYQGVISGDYTVIQPQHMLFSKIPSMLVDLVTAGLLAFIVMRWKGKRAGILAGLIYVLHPAVLYDSALWGQTDALYTLFLTLALAGITWKSPELTGASIVFSILTKQQSIVFAPILLAALPWKPSMLFRSIGAGLLGGAYILLPFIFRGDFEGIFRVFNVVHVLGDSHVSWNAYNLWWAIMGPHAWDVPGSAPLMGFLSAQMIGLFLFGIVYLLAIATLRTSRSASAWPSTPMVFRMVLLIAVALFTLSAEMHERYLFPAMALGLPVAFASARDMRWYAALSMLFTLNLAAVFPLLGIDRALFAPLPGLSVVLSSCLVLLFLQSLSWLDWSIFHIWTSAFSGQYPVLFSRLRRA
jgi:Gpi18-like mannosyltransferase